jgi:hypothetical protein
MDRAALKIACLDSRRTSRKKKGGRRRGDEMDVTGRTLKLDGRRKDEQKEILKHYLMRQFEKEV